MFLAMAYVLFKEGLWDKGFVTKYVESEGFEKWKSYVLGTDDGTEKTYQTITLTLFDLGTFETPGLPLTISDGNGAVLEELSPPVALTVVPTLAEDDTTLKDIRPQVGIKVPSLLPWMLGGWLLAAALAGSGYWLYRRRRGKSKSRARQGNRPRPEDIRAQPRDGDGRAHVAAA